MDKFSFDGNSIESLGIRLQKPLYISPPVPRVQSIYIPGRNGNLTYFDGSYNNRTIRASCYILEDAVATALPKINNWLMLSQGYRKLKTDDTHFFMAQPKYAVAEEIRDGVLNAFDLEFDCKPQRFLESGENPISISESATETISNPTRYPARPLLYIIPSDKGGGTIEFNQGETILKIDSRQKRGFFYDCETDQAYEAESGTTINYFVKVYANTSKGKDIIEFVSGDTYVTSTAGLCEITPRWWEL